MNTKKQLDFCPKQTAIMELLIQGLSNSAIAEQLKPPTTTGMVKQYLHKIYKQMGVNNRIEAMNKWKNV